MAAAGLKGCAHNNVSYPVTRAGASGGGAVFFPQGLETRLFGDDAGHGGRFRSFSGRPHLRPKPLQHRLSPITQTGFYRAVWSAIPIAENAIDRPGLIDSYAA